MSEYYQIDEKLNYFRDLRWEDLSLYEKTAIANSILDISLSVSYTHLTLPTKA